MHKYQRVVLERGESDAGQDHTIFRRTFRIGNDVMENPGT
jgi:hypothetical protein